MLVDSHCHLDRLKLDEDNGDLTQPLIRARENGVGAFLCISTDLAKVPNMLSLVEGQSDIYASVGVHPLSKEIPEIRCEDIVTLADHPQVVAIGETGLDNYYDSDHVEHQQQSFIEHLKASAVTQYPTIVHTRDAREDTLRLIAEHGDDNVGGVLHCFTESLEMALAAIDMNYFISFSGIITFNNAAELRDVVKAIPLERILVETDSPWLTPMPHRGKSNEPKYVKQVAECVANIKGISYDEVIDTTGANFQRLFNVTT